MSGKHTPGPGGTFELSGLSFSDDQQNTETFAATDFPVYAAAPDLLATLQSQIAKIDAWASDTNPGNASSVLLAVGILARDAIAKATRP